MSETPRFVEEAETTDLSAADLVGIQRLMDAAFGDRFSDDDWSHALGGRHFFVRDTEGGIVSHASVVGRAVGLSGHLLSAGYVEAVATRPESRNRGLAAAVMRSAAQFISQHFQIGALSGAPDSYEKLGWIRWRGPTWCRGERGLSRTADEDGGVFVLPTPSSPPLDLEADISVEWRRGDVW
jgi:aminoglycoside 2'-N-acetyltransferase I